MNEQNADTNERARLLKTVNQIFSTDLISWWTDTEMQDAIYRLGELREPRAIEALTYMRDNFHGDYPKWADAAIKRIHSTSAS